MLSKKQIEALGTQNLVAPSQSALPANTEDVPFIYQFQAMPNHLVEPEMYLHIQGHVKKFVNGKEEEPDRLDDACFCHLAPQAMIKDVTVCLNQTRITTNQGSHPYLALLQSWMNYSDEERKFMFARSCHYPDEPGQHNNFKGPEDAEEGTEPTATAFTRRRAELFQNFDFYTPLLLDIVQKQPYPDNVTINITVTRNSPKFYINGDVPIGTEYQIIISKADLCYRRVQISKGLFESLGLKEMTYAYKKYESRFNTVAAEQSTYGFEVYEGDYPEKVHIFSVSQEAKNGSYGANPFYLQHNLLKSIYLEINNVLRIPLNQFEIGIFKRGDTKRFKRDLEAPPTPSSDPGVGLFEKPKKKRAEVKKPEPIDGSRICDYSRIYMESMLATKCTPNSPINCPITYNEFGKGYCLISFDPRKDRSPNEAQKFMKQDVGTIRLIGELHKTLPKPVVLFSILEFNALFTVKANGEVVHQM